MASASRRGSVDGRAMLQLSVPLGALAGGYLLFRAKHFVADFVLQTGWMVRGKGRADGWLTPLMAHAGIHAVGTAAIALIMQPALWWLAPVDLVAHAVIDRCKAMPLVSRCCGRDTKHFWWAFGLDQEAHNLTHFAFLLLLITGS